MPGADGAAAGSVPRTAAFRAAVAGNGPPRFSGAGIAANVPDTPFKYRRKVWHRTTPDPRQRIRPTARPRRPADR
ncbi:hypothetical protein Snoj_27570 [Streptomyces nojiriensis]|uniref:Uncharacterized protein n=1 Tax=Streptomyces nojiriensis TaxID=66374 RepID=A0ABQ3SKU8_9ACTN|nr:hypothetical protein GCM10010205_72790 [Streptomyces nojiriensis]GHI68753.1 hypothetical protein Snoj_26710 [Streptomyces nojiriensis]GHI68839.1 hypothetical protein Snoj_27570 [Streptomyces nojiriensis]